MMKKTFQTYAKRGFLGLAIVLANFVFIRATFAATDVYAPGDTITLGDFLYDDNNNMNATTTPCTITMYDPNNTLIASSVPMTALSTGWHFYSTSTLYAVGLYPAVMSCGSVAASNLISEDLSFRVGYIQASTTPIAAADSVALTSGLSTAEATITATLAADIASGTAAVNAETDSVVNNASSSLATAISAGTAAVNSNTNSQFTTAISTINANTNATVLTASTSHSAKESWMVITTMIIQKVTLMT